MEISYCTHFKHKVKIKRLTVYETFILKQTIISSSFSSFSSSSMFTIIAL